ncbi:hypothetical protein PHET_07905, partial [Paragonimus heterotremus]
IPCPLRLFPCHCRVRQQNWKISSAICLKVILLDCSAPIESYGCPPKVEFIFLIAGEFLTTSIGEHLTGRQIVSESLEIEYCVKQQAPIYVAGIDQEDLISSVKRHKDYVLTGSYDGTVQIWTAETPKQLQSIQLEEKVKCVEWLTVGSDQATFATGGFDQTAQIWVWNIKTNTITCAAICRGHSETVMTIAAQPVFGASLDSQLFASGSWDGTIKLWSASAKESDLSEETGGIVHTRKSINKTPTRIPRVTMAGHRETVTRVCWLPVSSNDSSNTDQPSGSAVHSQLLSASWDHTLRVWDCQTGAGSELRSIVSSHAIHDADAALQGILTASSDNRVRIYDLRAREALALIGFHGHTAWLTSVAWAPHRDNQFVTGSVDRSLYGTLTLPSVHSQCFPMPLILTCGYPCSGKSSVVERLVKSLQSNLPNFEFVVIPEPPLSTMCIKSDVLLVDPRTEIYTDSKKERELRGQHKSEVERALTASCPSGDRSRNRIVVIMDAPNYIKGYRYEMYCLAKSLKHPHAVLFCDTQHEKCLEWNTKLGRYPHEVISDMITRFEPPQASNRWDCPLVTIRPDVWPSVDELDINSVLSELQDTVLSASSNSIKPNRSTQLASVVPTDFLQELERFTQLIVDHIMVSQSMGATMVGLPQSIQCARSATRTRVELDSSVQLVLVGRERQFTLANLTRAKRRYISLQRGKLMDSSVVPDPVSIACGFLRFLATADVSCEAPVDSLVTCS